MSAAQRVYPGSRDSISSLPDEVLGKILSFLPTRLAASTSVLSKRWRNLLSLVDNLNLTDASGGDPRGFSTFVDTALTLLNTSSIIKRFSLYCEHRHDKTKVDTWILTVLNRRSFSELHLDSACLHLIKAESFTSNTLVKLTLSNGFYLSGFPPLGGVFFPKLKTLSLLSVGFETWEVYEHLISGCPLLEELSIRYGSPSACKWMVVTQSRAVESSSVKRLTISYPFRGYCEPYAGGVFRTPSLVYLDLSGYVAGYYYVDFSSLVEARMDIRQTVDEDGVDEDSSNGGEWGEDVYDDEDDSCFDEDDDGDADHHHVFGEDNDIHDDDDEDEHNAYVDDEDIVFGVDDDDINDDDGEDNLPDVENLVGGISNVKTLHLSPYSLEVFHIYCKSMPVFHKLLTLSFESNKEKGWQVVPLLLNNSPNLETLVIKGLVHQVTDKCGDACVCISKKKKKRMEEEEVCCLSTCQVKVLKISGYGGTRRERKQMRHFLRNMKCLETVKVGLEAQYHQEANNVNSNYQRITNALTKLPRASSNCQIHFF